MEAAAMRIPTKRKAPQGLPRDPRETIPGTGATQRLSPGVSASPSSGTRRIRIAAISKGAASTAQ